MNKIKRFVSTALLCWFIAISISLIIGILFLIENVTNDVSTVIYNLWIISLLVVPVPAIASFYPRKIIGLLGVVIVLLVLSYTIKNISFPKLESITFIALEIEEEVFEGSESEKEVKIDLPDEL